MPHQEKVTERYWTVCWAWIFPYPCRKTRTITKWCYNFSSVHESYYIFVSRFYGCENGREYKWTKGCFGWFDAYYTGIRLCFKKRLKDLGSCREKYSLPPGGNIPPEPGPSNYPLRNAGSSMIVVSATMISYTEYQIIQAYLQKVGTIPASKLLTTALYGVRPSAIILGFGGLLLISAVISFFKKCQIGGMLSILIGILLIIIVLIFRIFTDYTLLAGLALNIIGAIINIRNSSHICE